MDIGSKIKELRLHNNMDQKTLAQKLDVQQSAISKWELNKNEPDLETVAKIAKLFDVTTDYLIGLED